MYILGISCYYHDSAAALIKDGVIIAAAQEERFTRKKHDERFPIEAINYCLKEAGITEAELTHIAFYEKPLLKFERLLESYIYFAPRGLRTFLMAMPIWLKKKLWFEEDVNAYLPDFEGEVMFTGHHESHAASAFFPSPFFEAAILTIDGVGEWSTTTIGRGEGNRITMLQEINFPHSLGLLYSAFTYYLGFKVNSGEYKVMGLAPYGTPKYKDLILDNLIDVKDDGSFRLDLSYFNYMTGLTMTNEKFDQLFGMPRREDESELKQVHMDIAASLQAVTEEIVLKLAQHAQDVTGMKNICLAGGVALNCVANGKLLRKKIFDDVWVQPAAGDAGGALGAAFLAWHHYEGEPRTVSKGTDQQMGSYLGPSFSKEEIISWLAEHKIPFVELNESLVAPRVAKLLSDGNAIGHFAGRMEFGPRALGGRSILGDPRNPKMQETLNLKIKFRESFRPFAPSVLMEHVHDWFDLKTESPYMLIVADVDERIQIPERDEDKEKEGLERLRVLRSSIPAITHVDYSARIQTVHKETNPKYHELLTAFYNLTGCPVVVNTSFNVRGEPIVATPHDAYTCFMRTKMDYLLLDTILLDKQDQPEFHDSIDWRGTYELD